MNNIKLKILVLTDIHSRYDAIDKLISIFDKIKPNIIIVAGDITNFGTVDEAEEILGELSYKNALKLFIPGNCDPSEMLYIDKLSDFINIHENVISYSGIKFFGIGGSLITPFNTNIEFTDDEIKNLLKPIERPFILVTHSPPYNTALDIVSWSGEHAGSKSIREYIEKYQPNLVVTGHIHEARGIDTIGVSTIVNPGPVKNKYFAEVDFTVSEVNVFLRRF